MFQIRVEIESLFIKWATWGIFSSSSSSSSFSFFELWIFSFLFLVILCRQMQNCPLTRSDTHPKLEGKSQKLNHSCWKHPLPELQWPSACFNHSIILIATTFVFACLKNEKLIALNSSVTKWRYLVANRDIEQGEIIIFEEPLVIGPKQATYPVCLSCYRRVDGSYLCNDCGWPLCDQKCQNSNEDHQAECQFLAAQHVSVQVDTREEDCRVYDCVAPLRALLAMKEFADRRETLSRMETHHPHRRDIGIWDVDHVSVVDVMRREWALYQHFSQEEIQTVS